MEPAGSREERNRREGGSWCEGRRGAAVDDQAAGEGDWTETESLMATGEGGCGSSDLIGSALGIHIF